MLRKIVAIILAVSLSACDPEIDANVLYLGDSLMVSAAGRIASINTANSRSALTMFEVLGGTAIEHSDYFAARLANVQSRVELDEVFISLGSNVYDKTKDPSQGIAEILNAISPNTRVCWIVPHSNVRNIRDSETYDATLEALKTASESGEWPNLTLLSLDEYAESNAISLVDSWLAPDGVHLSEAGISAWTTMLYAYQAE
ncbi:MAG: hypothetical protein R3E64_05270 [Halioglobus sp.]